MKHEGADKELSDKGSPRVIVYGYDGLSLQPVAPPSPEYVPGLEHPSSPDYMPGPEHPPSLVKVPYVPELEYPEYLVPSDAEARLEDQPLPVDIILSFDLVPSARDIEAFETDEFVPTPRSPQTKVPFSQTRLRRARKTIPSPPLPPPPPPSSLHLLPPVPTSLPLPLSPLLPLPASLSIPPPVDRREDIHDAELPPRKRLCLTTPTLRYEVEESSTAAPRPTRGHRADYVFIGTMDAKIRRYRAEKVDYGIKDVWVYLAEAVEEVASTTLEEVNARVTELVARVDVLIKDRQFHHETALLLDQEALASRKAWTHSVGLSSGQVSVALGQIQALQARDQTHADDPEGASSSV
ncbi:hypothetical protein Tco_1004789 [Tanacetum coccineum]|uniref:Uncharacterized protein n=1 Tax=Tanacetum coccineum TaxID=301880 RepID=A0ABQ5FDA2_9ASTR